MVEPDEPAEHVGWLTFTMHPIRLVPGEAIAAEGHLIDGNHYSLRLKVVWVDTQAVRLSYAGHIGKDPVPAQEITLHLIARDPVALHITAVEGTFGSPPLCAGWESSIRVVPGETAVLLVGQRSAPQTPTRKPILPVLLINLF